jgi:hypothetical protein
VRKGTRRDAILYAVGANEGHGLRRTPADKRKAVLTLLEDPEWSKWSNYQIAEACKVTPPFVLRLRRESLVTVTSDRASRQTSSPPPATLAEYEAAFQPYADDTPSDDPDDDPPESGGESAERVYRNRYGEVGKMKTGRRHSQRL